MRFFEKLSQLWNQLCVKVKPVLTKAGAFCKKATSVLRRVWIYVVKLRKIILAVPVAWGAVALALRNLTKLPPLVGLNLQADGTFGVQLQRLPAVLAPLLVTAVCLLLMFCSKRTLTPWLVSLLTLVLPIVIFVINMYPA